MRRCIYCLEDKPPSDFNAEHVIPQQLGQFDTNSPTLCDVCRSCNQHFGDTVELLLGRDSYEAFLRFRQGIKPLSKIGQFQGRRVEFCFPDGSEWARVRLRLGASADGTNTVMELPPQIGVRSYVEEHFTYLLEEEFRAASKEWIARSRNKYAIVSRDPESHKRLIAMLKERVPQLRIDGVMGNAPVVDGQLMVSMTSTLDKEVARAIAKIGFNYLAYVTGADFVLKRIFDRVRQFIRYGHGERSKFVGFQQQPILRNDSPRYKVTQGHIVVVDWHGTNEIRARVSPFNGLTYQIILCTGFDGIWRPIESGHLFDWEDHTVVQLDSLRRPSPHLVIQPITLFPP